MIYSGKKTKGYRPLNADTALKKLRLYAHTHGFQYDGKVYFTSGWSPRAVLLLEEKGLVRRAGKPEDLRRAGITVPEDFAALYRGHTLYVAKLNLISETVN